jgi:hypothetical protein
LSVLSSCLHGSCAVILLCANEVGEYTYIYIYVCVCQQHSREKEGKEKEEEACVHMCVLGGGEGNMRRHTSSLCHFLFVEQNFKCNKKKSAGVVCDSGRCMGGCVGVCVCACVWGVWVRGRVVYV